VPLGKGGGPSKGKRSIQNVILEHFLNSFGFTFGSEIDKSKRTY
jgi:hypothetical protein